MTTVGPTLGQAVNSRSTWASGLLILIGAPVTQNNISTITAWETAEGGAGPQFGVKGNVTNYNPLNITLTTGSNGYGYDPGSGTYYAGASPTSGNNPPVASFSNWETGLAATSARLTQPFASGILNALRNNESTAQVAAAVAASGWGTGNFASTKPVDATASQAGASGNNAETSGGVVGTQTVSDPGAPSTIAGIPGTAPSAPSIDKLNPIGSLASMIPWFGEFLGWAALTMIVFWLGMILVLLGVAVLIAILAGPAVGPVTAAVGGKSPTGRIIGGVAGTFNRGTESAGKTTAVAATPKRKSTANPGRAVTGAGRTTTRASSTVPRSQKPPAEHVKTARDLKTYHSGRSTTNKRGTQKADTTVGGKYPDY